MPPIYKSALWSYIPYQFFLGKQWLYIEVSVVCPIKTPLVWKFHEEQILIEEGGIVVASLDLESMSSLQALTLSQVAEPLPACNWGSASAWPHGVLRTDWQCKAP